MEILKEIQEFVVLISFSNSPLVWGEGVWLAFYKIVVVFELMVRRGTRLRGGWSGLLVL